MKHLIYIHRNFILEASTNVLMNSYCRLCAARYVKLWDCQIHKIYIFISLQRNNVLQGHHLSYTCLDVLKTTYVCACMLIKVANSIMVLSLLGIKVIYFEGQYIIYNLNEECWNSYVDSLSLILGVLVYKCVQYS